MKVWLVTIGEPLPTDEGAPRLLRAGLLARHLGQSGHEVLWWTSTFDHQRKRLRATETKSVSPDASLKLVLLHGRPYRRNVSLQRLINHWELAQQFAAMAPKEPRPDVVLASYPSIELCDKAVAYGHAHQVPVVIDVRDLWPDIFLQLAPRWARSMARLALTPMFRQSRRACHGATAIFGITDPIRDWGIQRAGRARNALDATFPLAYPEDAPDPAALQEAGRYWDKLGATRNRRIACFFGSFGRQVDMDCVIAAARLSRQTDPELLWVLCGDGDQWIRCSRLAAGLENVLLPGWVERPAIHALMQRAQFGLAPYRDLPDFRMSIPNKVIEYLSAGLPVVTTLEGAVREKLERAGAGVFVSARDPAQIARTAHELVSDAARQSRLSAAASQLYQAEFKADKVFAQMVDQLQRVAGRGQQ